MTWSKNIQVKTSLNTMKKSKWPDFLFTVAVRFICGMVLGCLGLFLINWRGVLRAFSRNDMHSPLVLLVLCGLAGGIAGVFTVPHWQTPWYNGIRGRDDDHNDA
jgi:H+/Cl- antiporter ClcA